MPPPKCGNLTPSNRHHTLWLQSVFSALTYDSFSFDHTFVLQYASKFVGTVRLCPVFNALYLSKSGCWRLLLYQSSAQSSQSRFTVFRLKSASQVKIVDWFRPGPCQDKGEGAETIRCGDKGSIWRKCLCRLRLPEHVGAWSIVTTRLFLQCPFSVSNNPVNGSALPGVAGVTSKASSPPRFPPRLWRQYGRLYLEVQSIGDIQWSALLIP